MARLPGESDQQALERRVRELERVISRRHDAMYGRDTDGHPQYLNEARHEALNHSAYKDVVNDSATTITAGSLVSVTGNNGVNALVELADKDSPPDGGSVDGIAVEDIAASDVGRVQVGGVATDLDTSAFSGGEPVWLGNSGGMVSSVPSSGTIVRVGKVGIAHPSQGTLLLQLPAFESVAGEVTYEGTLSATRVDAALDELDESKPGGFVGYQTYESASTAISSTGSGTELMTVDVDVDTSRRYRVSAHVRYSVSTAGDRQCKQTVLVDGAEITSTTELVNEDDTAGTLDIESLRLSWVPSSSGTVTVSLNALRFSGATSLIARGSSDVPGELIVEDIGPV